MNKNLLFAVVALASPLCGHAQLQPTFTEWHDCAVNEVNRFPLHTDFFAFESADKALKGEKEHSNNYLSLEGDWKFNWVANADERLLSACFQRCLMGQDECAGVLGS